MTTPTVVRKDAVRERPTRTWVYVQPHIVGSPGRGYSTSYSSDLEHCETRSEAWQQGLWRLGHDDFLVAAIENGVCVALYHGETGPKRRSVIEVREVNAEFGLRAQP